MNGARSVFHSRAVAGVAVLTAGGARRRGTARGWRTVSGMPAATTSEPRPRPRRTPLQRSWARVVAAAAVAFFTLFLPRAQATSWEAHFSTYLPGVRADGAD